MAVALVIGGCGRVGFSQMDADGLQQMDADGLQQMDADACSTPLCTGLVAYWKLDGDLVDVVAGRSLTLIGGVALDRGALNFDASDNGPDTRAMVRSDQSLDKLLSLTFTARINARSAGKGKLGPILAKGGAGTRASKRWLINGLSDGRLHMEFTINGAADASSSTEVDLSTWRFAAATFDSTLTSDRIHLYVEQNTVVSEVSYMSPPVGSGEAEDDSATPYAIGAWPEPMQNGVFDGAIDEIQIYKRALSLDELRELYQRQPR